MKSKKTQDLTLAQWLPNHMPKFFCQASGFSLIEVMVALFVLSTGLLGIAALQTVGLKYNWQSYQRTQAVFQTYDIIDRIRANPAGKANGDYDSVTAGQGNGTPIAPDCTAVSCDPDQLAAYDIIKWNTANGKLLTDGKGAISAAVSAGRRTVTVTMTWKENDLPMTLAMTADL